MNGRNRFTKNVLMILMMVCGFCMCKMPVEAATTAQKEGFRAELEEMLYTADTSVHDVSEYKMTTSEFKNLYQEMKDGDCQLIVASYYSNMDVRYTTNGFWIDTIQLTNVDSGVLPRYERLKNNVGKILAGVEEGMTELDKIIYLHDAIVELVDYKFVAYQSYGACGALGDREAVCAGYTKAYNLLLKMQGIEAYYAEGNGLNHGWTYVNLDGEWYHADTTWDDTRSPVKGITSHQFLLRNDKEFAAGGSNSHIAWIIDDVSNKSTSGRFSDWYVHDIAGKMCFEDGYWYYVDTTNNDILCADALGREKILVLDGSKLDKLTIVDVEDGMITYKKGSIEVTEKLENAGNDIIIEDTVVKNETMSSPGGNVEISKGESINTYDFNDISKWREGQYRISDGAYAEAAGYICTKEYVEVGNKGTFRITMKDSRFHTVINEYRSDGSLVASSDLVNGNTWIPNAETAYIGVSIYFPNWKTISFAEYTTKFKNELMSLEVEVLAWEEEPGKNDVNTGLKVESYGSIETVNFNDINVWKMGGYDPKTGAFSQLEGYICTKKYVEIGNKGTFRITMKDSRFHTVINEYRSDGSLVASSDLVNGNTWISNAETAYIGVSIYFPNWKTISFAEYTTKFKNELMSLEVEVLAWEEEPGKNDVNTGLNVESYGSIETVNFNDINVWKMGGYDPKTGAFSQLEGYICTKKYVEIGNKGTFRITMKDSRFHTVINEYRSDGSLVASSDLVNGNTWIPNAETTYIGVSIYFPNWKTISFAEYTTKFKNELMSLEVEVLAWEEESGKNDVNTGLNVESYGSIETVNFNDINVWKMGGYDPKTGAFSQLEGYICTKKYVEVGNKGTFRITMKDSRFHTVINEYRSDGSLVASSDLVNGNTWIPNAETAYIGVSIYFPNWKTISFAEYTAKFTYNLMSLEINRN